jgi:hypothetical protein
MSFLGLRSSAVDGRAKPGHDGWCGFGVKSVDIFDPWYQIAAETFVIEGI